MGHRVIKAMKRATKGLKVMKATTSLVLVHEALIRVRVRVRVTKLVYQIGFTTLL